MPEYRSCHEQGFDKITTALETQNRKIDDLIAAILTLASVEQRRLHIEHPSESDDVIEHFESILLLYVNCWRDENECG